MSRLLEFLMGAGIMCLGNLILGGFLEVPSRLLQILKQIMLSNEIPFMFSGTVQEKWVKVRLLMIAMTAIILGLGLVLAEVLWFLLPARREWGQGSLGLTTGLVVLAWGRYLWNELQLRRFYNCLLKGELS